MNRSLSLALGKGAQPYLIAAGVVAAFAVGLLGVTYLNLSIWLLLLPLAAAGYGFVVIQRPIVGLFVVTCIFFLPIRIGGVTLLQTVGVMTAGLIMVWFLVQKREVRFGNVSLPLFLLGLLVLGSFFFTRDVARTAVFFRLWVFNMFFALLLINLVRSFDLLKRLVWAILLMASANAIAGVLDYATSTEARFRSEGLLENANQFGNLAALAFPLALYQYLYAKGMLRWISLALALSCVAGVVASVSRGAVIALIVVSSLIVISERRRAWALALVVVLLLVAAPLAPDYFFERLGNLLEDVKNTVLVGGSEDLTVRGHYNRGGLRIWMANPIFGVGIGNFGYYFVEREFNPGVRASNLVPAHNIYLQAAAEMGAVGFAVLLWLISVTVVNLVRARRRNRGDPERWRYYGAVEMMAITVLIGSFSTGNIMAEDFWLLICLAAVTGRIARRELASVQPA